MEPQPESKARPMSTRPNSSSDFQAIILAGGSRSQLHPLTHGFPKALLPIANTPLLVFQLRMLEKSGITDVIIVTTAAAAPGMKQVVAGFTTSTVMDIKIEVCEPEEGLGTADALRQVKDQIVADCVVLSCDLVTDQPLDAILDTHRIHQGALTIQLARQPPVDPKKKRSVENFVMLDETSDAVLMVAQKSKLAEFLDIRRCIFNKYPSVSIRTDLVDCHIYVFSRWALDVLDSQPAMRSVKCDLVPYLLRKQYSVYETDATGIFGPGASENKLAVATQMTSSVPAWPAGPTGMATNLHCHACIVDPAAGPCARVTTIPAYHELNRLAAKAHTPDDKEVTLLLIHSFGRSPLSSHWTAASGVALQRCESSAGVCR